jgi:hypothetical protein
LLLTHCYHPSIILDIGLVLDCNLCGSWRKCLHWKCQYAAYGTNDGAFVRRYILHRWAFTGWQL